MAKEPPREPTTFIGRAQELQELGALLDERRLVTLTGPGGAGKTRLAARYCAEKTDAGLALRWVDLGSVSDPGLVVRTVADAVGVLADPGTDAAALAARLRDRRLLLCLDTCEHVLDAAALLVDRLLRTCPEVVLLATSREPLTVAGETVYRVPSLNDEDAVALFADRAALADPRRQLTELEAEVASICDRLDGIPLAVELAAAWVSTLAPQQIAAGLDDSLHLLGGGPRTALPRHQTLIASLDWSYALLTDDEQRVLRRLSVFSGSFSTTAAGAVGGQDGDENKTLAVMRRLVDKSLVVVASADADVRYRLLDVVRQYANAKLVAADEVETAHDRHLDHYLQVVLEAESGFDTDQDTWRVALDREHDQVHIALQRSLREENNAERLGKGIRLTAAMARQWFVRGQSQEGLAFIERAIELTDPDDGTTLARLHGERALLAMVAGRVDLLDESVPIAEHLAAEIGDDVVLARARVMRAYPQFFFDAERCQRTTEEAMELAERAGDVLTRDWARNLAAYTMTRRDRHDEAIALARRAYEGSMPRTDRLCAGFALGVEMFAKAYTGDVTGAVELGHEVMRIVEPLGDYFAYGSNATNVALALGMSGDIDGAYRIMHSVVRSVDGVQDVDVVGYMFTYGLLALWSDDPGTAYKWLHRGVRLADTFEWTAVRCLAPLATAQRRLGKPGEAAATAARALEMATAVDGEYVRAEALDEQARLVAETDAARAFDLHHRALALRREHGLRTFYADSLDALGRLLAATRSGDDNAVRLLAAADSARNAMGYPRAPADSPSHEHSVAALRERLGPDDFATCWADGIGFTLDEAVAFATRGRGTHARPDAGWASLTPTELDVARMVADGLTNPEIGRRLYISRSTVKTHLSHVYAKLGISGRAELAARFGKEHNGS